MAIESANPQNILFSIPTLNDAIPNNFGEATPTSSTVSIHEDDWRQFEFVSSSFGPLINQEIASIDAIWRDQNVKSPQVTAFRTLHTRKLIPDPFDGVISAKSYAELFKADFCYFTFLNCPKVLNGVYAVRMGGLIFYLAVNGDRLCAAGIKIEGKPAVDHDTAERVAGFIANNNLVLIHWPSMTIFQTPESVQSYFETGKAG